MSSLVLPVTSDIYGLGFIYTFFWSISDSVRQYHALCHVCKYGMQIESRSRTALCDTYVNLTNTNVWSITWVSLINNLVGDISLIIAVKMCNCLSRGMYRVDFDVVSCIYPMWCVNLPTFKYEQDWLGFDVFSDI